jgi:hypothetical protein
MRAEPPIYRNIAAVSPKSDQILRSGGYDGSGAEQASRLRNSITIKCLRLMEREWRRRVGVFRGPFVMAALFKYFVGIAFILPAVIILSAVNMGEIFVGFALAALFGVTPELARRVIDVTVIEMQIGRLRVLGDSENAAKLEKILVAALRCRACNRSVQVCS